MKSLLLATTLLLSSISFAGPNCIWDLESTEVKNMNGSKLNLERYDCRNKGYWENEVIADVYMASVINTKGEAITLEDSDNYEVIRLMADTPINALYFSYPGSSNAAIV